MSEEVEPHVSERFEIIQKLGKGAYGVVWKARNRKTGQMVALKKVYDAFQNSTDAQRTYREVMYLQHLNGHENIIRLLSIIRAFNNKDLYLVFDLMETDLHVVIRAKILKPIHKQFILYQLFKALKYIHSADMIHRDLKPSNMLINSDCLMKLADFGLARSIAATDEGFPIVSEYIATRWYRAPEILLGSTHYTKAVDVWSAGCILVELLTEKVLFAGKSSLNQVEQIIELLGRPAEKDMGTLNIAANNNLLSGIKTGKTRSLTSLMSPYGADALDLARCILRWSPDQRPTIEQILSHRYFAQFHCPEEEIVCPRTIQIPISDNEKLSLKVYRDAIYENISAKVKEQNKNVFLISTHFTANSQTAPTRTEVKPTPLSKDKPKEHHDEAPAIKQPERALLRSFNKENTLPKRSLGDSAKNFFTPGDELQKKRSADNIKSFLYKNKSPELSGSKASPFIAKKTSNSLKSEKKVTELDDSKNKLAKKKSDALLTSNQLLQKYQNILKNSASNVFAPKQSACFLFKSKVK